MFLITTILFGLMALAPNSAPIKTSSTRDAAEVGQTRAIESVSTRFTENLLTYKFATVEQDIDKALEDATDRFRTAEHKALGGTITQFRQLITARQGTSTADVKGTSITSQDDETATVLVTYFRNYDSAERQPTSSFLVLELTLLKQGGSWKVDIVGEPGKTIE